jgi:hypothetical protein
MDGPKLLNLLRQDWWWLAVVVGILWTIECVIEGNTFFEILVGPVVVGLWLIAIILIDRWVLRASDRGKAGYPAAPTGMNGNWIPK